MTWQEMRWFNVGAGQVGSDGWIDASLCWLTPAARAICQQKLDSISQPRRTVNAPTSFLKKITSYRRRGCLSVHSIAPCQSTLFAPVNVNRYLYQMPKKPRYKQFYGTV